MTAELANDPLETAVTEARRTIAADGYPMSIGELTNLYKDGELLVRPEFQRYFRWTPLQKSRLVESLLLGIPLPSIFVSQSATGNWELVDGLQRVSTILELQGELKGEGHVLPPLVLTGTKFLPALEGRQWDSGDPTTSLSQALRLDIKRTKIDLKIIKRESSAQAKYDLFQRLNNYGSRLTPQELRAALLVAVSPKFFAWAERLARYPSFVTTTNLRPRLRQERYDLELTLRFLVLHALPDERITRSTFADFSQFLDDATVALANNYPNGDPALESTFKTTFDVIEAHGGETVFHRYSAKKDYFVSPFLNTAFEVFALGLGNLIASGKPHRTDLLVAAKEFWSRPEMTSGFATGRSTAERLGMSIPSGRDLLALP